MKVLKFKNNQPEWDIPLPELAPDLKRILRMQWREFIHEIEVAEGADNQRIRTDLAIINMFERSYKAG
jgi:hypothetical protein